MAKQKIQNGQAEYGVVHVDEERMREAGVGVFEESSSEAGQKRTRKAASASPETKMEAAPENKAISSLDHDGDGRKGGSTKGSTSTRAKGAAKKART